MSKDIKKITESILKGTNIRKALIKEGQYMDDEIDLGDYEKDPMFNFIKLNVGDYEDEDEILDAYAQYKKDGYYFWEDGDETSYSVEYKGGKFIVEVEVEDSNAERGYATGEYSTAKEAVDAIPGLIDDAYEDLKNTEESQESSGHSVNESEDDWPKEIKDYLEKALKVIKDASKGTYTVLDYTGDELGEIDASDFDWFIDRYADDPLHPSIRAEIQEVWSNDALEIPGLDEKLTELVDKLGDCPGIIDNDGFGVDDGGYYGVIFNLENEFDLDDDDLDESKETTGSAVNEGEMSEEEILAKLQENGYEDPREDEPIGKAYGEWLYEFYDGIPTIWAEAYTKLVADKTSGGTYDILAVGEPFIDFNEEKPAAEDKAILKEWGIIDGDQYDGYTISSSVTFDKIRRAPGIAKFIKEVAKKYAEEFGLPDTVILKYTK